MKTPLRFLLSTVGGVVLSFISLSVSRQIEQARNTHLFIPLVAFSIVVAYILLSYLLHRRRCRKLRETALKLANTFGSANVQVERLKYESEQCWKQSKILLSLSVSIISSPIALFVVPFIAKDDPTAKIVVLNVAICGIGTWIVRRTEEAREQSDFERNLKAANEGRWFPKDDATDEDEQAPARQAKTFVADLTEKNRRIAVEGD